MFRVAPSETVVNGVLRSLKFTGLTDNRWFSKEELPLDTLEEWLPLLEPYYLPCKAERYLHVEMTQQRIITILRHILKAIGVEFRTQERMVNGRKTTLYQVFSKQKDTLVRFD